MHSISNNTISIKVASKGAELQSLFNKQNQLEYMWSGDPAYWAKHSPVLFPVVGELKNKAYSYNGRQYKLSRHGFARDMPFVLTEHSDSSLTFSLKSNEQTLEVYPFTFIFSVRYTLKGNSLQIAYIIQNTGDEAMLFSVGGHPAFKVPLVDGTDYEDYELIFDRKETAGRWPISSEGLIENQSIPLLHNNNTLPLKKELFLADAIVLKHLRSSSVTLKSAKTKYGLTVHFEGFPYLGIWEAKGGDFLCIEPWYGIADSVNSSGNLKDKDGINALEPSQKFEVSFTIELF